MSDFDQLSKAGRNLPPNPHTKTTETFDCPYLPNAEGSGWGRPVTIKKLTPVEQLVLVGRVSDGRETFEKMEAEGISIGLDEREINQPEQMANFWESVMLLQLACVDPVFSFGDAVKCLNVNEADGIPWGDVAQFLLVRIRDLHERTIGLEDVGHGLTIMKRFPLTLQMLESAYLAGPDETGRSRVQKLLEGNAEEAEFIERWGSIMSAVAFEVLRKQAKIQADETSEAILRKFIELAEAILQPKETE